MPKESVASGDTSQVAICMQTGEQYEDEGWMVRRFAASTMNMCPHQALPGLVGPPIRIHVDKDAVPHYKWRPAKVPLHWVEKVESDLLRDEHLGVIKRPPVGTETKFCSKMVITRKASGEPRRTVNLSHLNKQAKRELHSVKALFQLVRSIPPQTWKSVVDAWNGYHALEIHKDDSDLTTFVTEIGLFQYVHAPQGFLSSGDGYNRRMDKVMADVKRMVRCVDDMCEYDTELETLVEDAQTLGVAGERRGGHQPREVPVCTAHSGLCRVQSHRKRC